MKREDWNRHYAHAHSLRGLAPNRFLVAEAAGLAPGRALDLACGEGRNAIWLASVGWDVTAVDYSDVAIAKARARAAEEGVEVDFRVGDLVDFEPEARGTPSSSSSTSTSPPASAGSSWRRRPAPSHRVGRSCSSATTCST